MQRKPSSSESESWISLHQKLMNQLRMEGYLRSARIENAFQSVPRHRFLPRVDPHLAYRDQAIITKSREGKALSSSSQPAIMALMLECLDLQPGQNVLEIGAGTGYNAALMAHIVGAEGRVTTLDIDADVARRAKRNLARTGFPRVSVICADGGDGYAANAPYDRIILTVGVWDLPPGLRAQCRPEGRFVLPLSLNGPQVCVAFVPDGEGLVSIATHSCGFLRLRGAFAGPERSVLPNPQSGFTLECGDTPPVEASILADWFVRPTRQASANMQISVSDLWEGVAPWLAVHMPGWCYLRAENPAQLPARFAGSLGIALIEPDSFCLLTRLSEAAQENSPVASDRQIALGCRAFGPDYSLMNRMLQHLQAWDASGRPGVSRLHIRALPQQSPIIASEGEIAVEKRWMRFLCRWE